MEDVKISTAGFGYMGKLHTIAYKSMALCYENFNYNVILDKLLTSKKISENKLYYSEIVNKIEDMKGTDILDICTPNFIHGDEIKEASQIGIKNIYCEKPLTGKVEEEEKLTEFVQHENINNQVGFVLRYLPAVIRAKKLIEQGEIGDIINFNCHMYHSSYLNPDRPISWRLEKEKSGGGAFIDLGIHMVDLVHYVLGPITEINGYVKTFINKRPFGHTLKEVDVDDFAHMDIAVNNLVSGALEVSRVAAGKGEETCFEIFGTKGSIKIETSNPDLPKVYLLKDSTWHLGNYVTFNDAEKDISLLYPSGKYSLGWMVNTHMASLYSFIARTHGETFNYITVPTFEDSAKAMKVIDKGYKNV